MIRLATLSDAAAIADLYNYYILNTFNNFEEAALSAEDMQQRIGEVLNRFPWLVYESEQGEILGYAYATGWKSRCAYRNSVETSVYIRQGHLGKGIGKALYQNLLTRLKDLKIHAIIGGIALPNEASVILHERFGFEKVAHFKEVGYKFERWIDVGYWELILDKN